MKNNNEKGVTALLTITIIGAVTLIIALNSSLLGLGELHLGHTASKASIASIITDSCLEEVLYQIKLDSNYNGSSLVFNEGSCIINIIPSGNDRTITVTGTVENYNKKIEVTLTLSGEQIIINSWEEKDD